MTGPILTDGKSDLEIRLSNAAHRWSEEGEPEDVALMLDAMNAIYWLNGEVERLRAALRWYANLKGCSHLSDPARKALGEDVEG